MIWSDYFLLVFTVLLISLVIMQQSKDDISDAFSGEKSELFKNQKTRGFEFVLQVATLVVSCGFVIFAYIAGFGIGR